MSNMIQVGNEFCPFRWIGQCLEAWVGGEWVEVRRSGKKNEQGEAIFDCLCPARGAGLS